MIIGFGFRDEHIKKAIHDGAEKGLKIFVVDPGGVDATAAYRSAAIPSQSQFQNCIIGASRRTLRETFGDTDRVERAKLDRFLED